MVKLKWKGCIKERGRWLLLIVIGCHGESPFYRLGKLGSPSGEAVVRAFERAAWRVARRRSSHVILERDGYEATLSVPVHKGKDVKRGTLRDLIRDAKMELDEFLSYL